MQAKHDFSIRTVDVSTVAPPETCCRAPGCERRTTHGKPFCIDHLSELAGVRRLLEAVAQTTARDSAAREVRRMIRAHRTLPVAG